MRNDHLLIVIVIGIVTGTGIAAPGAAAPGSSPVEAAAETAPVPTSGDAADDAAVWVHPEDPGLSIIIGTDKNAGLALYDLDGTETAFLPVGNVNNVDVRYNFPLGGSLVDIVAAGNRSDQSLDVFAVDAATRTLTDVSAGPLPIGIDEAYGFCLYRSWVTGKTYAFVNDQEGDVEQYELVDDGRGKIGAELVRAFALKGQTEGMVADDRYGLLYVGEEEEGIWRYGAEPDAGADRVLVDSTDGPHLTADVEGLTIYHTGDGGGYLLASSQGDDTFAVYERVPGGGPKGGPNAWIKTFQVVDGDAIDGCEDTDGIDVTSVALGGAFPQGLFIAQDGENGGDHQNFKLVRWEEIALAGNVDLAIDTTWDPRDDPSVFDGPPAPATAPSPADGAANVSPNVTLSWSAGRGADSHDVYFGTDPTPDAGELQGNQAATTFSAGALDFETTYYWRIDEVNEDGTTPGVVWHFTTGDEAEGVSFLGEETIVTVTSESFDIPVPAGTAAGDLLVAVVAKEKNGGLFAPAGWSVIDEGGVDDKKIRLGVFSRVAGDAEPGAYTFTSATTGRAAIGSILRYGGAGSVTIDAVKAKDGDNAAPKAPKVETTVDGAVILRVFAAKGDDAAAAPYPVDHDGRFVVESGGKVTAGAADAEQRSAGSTGGAKFALDAERSWRAVTVAIAPAVEAPPTPAHAPSPGHGTTHVSPSAWLSWAAGSGATSHVVYFGTDPTPDAGELQGQQGAAAFDPGPLSAETTYFWRIDEVSDAGVSTGAVWSFTTGDGTDGVAFLGQSTVTTGMSERVEVPVPPGTVVGDLLVAAIAQEKDGEITAPPGWSVVDEGGGADGKVRLGVFSRTAGISEPEAYTFTSETAGRSAVGAILHYCCADGAAAIHASKSKSGASAAAKAPNLQATVDGALLLRVFAAKGDDASADPFPHQHVGRFVESSGGKITGAVADRVLPSAGPTGPAELALDASRPWRTVTVVIAPEGAAAAAYAGCPGDVDGDGQIGVEDVSIVIRSWEQADAASDIDGDGIVDVADLVAILMSWGSCPPPAP